MKVKALSRVQLLATPWTTAYQAPPSLGFSRQEYWSGVPLPSQSCLFIVNAVSWIYWGKAYLLVTAARWFHVLKTHGLVNNTGFRTEFLWNESCL